MSNLEKYYEAYNFPSLDKFYTLIKKDGVSINKSDVKLFLDSLESEQLMKQQVFDKNSLGAITAMGVNREWQIDLFFVFVYVLLTINDVYIPGIDLADFYQISSVIVNYLIY